MRAKKSNIGSPTDGRSHIVIAPSPPSGRCVLDLEINIKFINNHTYALMEGKRGKGGKNDLRKMGGGEYRLGASESIHSSILLWLRLIPM